VCASAKLLVMELVDEDCSACYDDETRAAFPESTATQAETEDVISVEDDDWITSLSVRCSDLVRLVHLSIATHDDQDVTSNTWSDDIDDTRAYNASTDEHSAAAAAAAAAAAYSSWQQIYSCNDATGHVGVSQLHSDKECAVVNGVVKDFPCIADSLSADVFADNSDDYCQYDDERFNCHEKHVKHSVSPPVGSLQNAFNKRVAPSASQLTDDGECDATNPAVGLLSASEAASDARYVSRLYITLVDEWTSVCCTDNRFFVSYCVHYSQACLETFCMNLLACRYYAVIIVNVIHQYPHFLVFLTEVEA